MRSPWSISPRMRNNWRGKGRVGREFGLCSSRKDCYVLFPMMVEDDDVLAVLPEHIKLFFNRSFQTGRLPFPGGSRSFCDRER